MDFEQVRPFMEKNHRGVITTFQADGAAQCSVVVCGAYKGHAAFCIVRGSSKKARNLRRDPRCTVLAVTNDWRSWVTVEGEAKLYDYHNTDAEEMRLLLRDETATDRTVTVDGYVRTGDLGTMHEGELYVTGRTAEHAHRQEGPR